MHAVLTFDVESEHVGEITTKIDQYGWLQARAFQRRRSSDDGGAHSPFGSTKRPEHDFLATRLRRLATGEVGHEGEGAGPMAAPISNTRAHHRCPSSAFLEAVDCAALHEHRGLNLLMWDPWPR